MVGVVVVVVFALAVVLIIKQMPRD